MALLFLHLCSSCGTEQSPSWKIGMGFENSRSVSEEEEGGCLEAWKIPESESLIVFKAGLQDPKAKLASWNEDDDSPYNWVRVKCDPRINWVSDLVLDGFSLSGHINRGILRLQFLQTLSLSKNNFT
ncbi:hypothetical protein FH972_009707 [Carpinus fangiana]|uniref:Leucine-rich repeat-containing N-terminal plant-type domain-containing protein n=1 Tax=Carpinus fangiana TaxID=176857 RepID=A0A660KMQ0_9ROSI|nr:hypothetical protein FH972_009707 [Carpinus fangiana]